MSGKVGYVWHLRRLMAERGLFATTELRPLLAERGVVLSREQVYRLVVRTPERLSLATLAALCDILDCGPGDLVEPVTGPAVKDVAQRGQRGQAQPLRDAGDQPVDLLTGQDDAALGQQRPQLRRGVHVLLGHQPPQVPPVADRPRHYLPSSPSNARASADRSIRFRASCPTVVYTAVVDAHE